MVRRLFSRGQAMRENTKILHIVVPWVLGMKILYAGAVIGAGISPVVVAGVMGAAHMIIGFFGVLKWTTSAKKKKPEFILSIFGFTFGVSVGTGLLSAFPLGSPPWLLGHVVTWMIVPYLFREVTQLLNPIIRAYESTGRSMFATGFSCWFTMMGGLVCMRVFPNEPSWELGLIGPGIALLLFVFARSLLRPKRD